MHAVHASCHSADPRLNALAAPPAAPQIPAPVRDQRRATACGLPYRSASARPSGYCLELQERVVRISRRQGPVRAVGDKVERFQHDLADQDFAQWRSHDAVGHHCPVPKSQADRTGQRSFFAPLVGVGDECRSLLLQPQSFHDVLGQDQRYGARVDDAVDGRPPDVGLLAVSAVEQGPVALCSRGSRWNESLPLASSSDCCSVGGSGATVRVQMGARHESEGIRSGV